METKRKFYTECGSVKRVFMADGPDHAAQLLIKYIFDNELSTKIGIMTYSSEAGFADDILSADNDSPYLRDSYLVLTSAILSSLGRYAEAKELFKMQLEGVYGKRWGLSEEERGRLQKLLGTLSGKSN